MSSKQDRTFDNFVSVIQQHMGGKGYRPSTTKELIEALGIVPQHQGIFRKALRRLAKDEVVEYERKRYHLRTSRRDVVSGTISMHPRGFGFVTPDDALRYPEDIFIPRNFTHNAVDRDEVEVLVLNDGGSAKGPEGKVVAITRRARSHLAGTVLEQPKRGRAAVHVPLLGEKQDVIVKVPKGESLVAGDRIVMEVTDWAEGEEPVRCRFSHRIGHISDPNCDVKAAIEEYGLRNEFPAGVRNEAKSFGQSVQKKEIATRLDLRDLECVTIDPDTAKDFDDAISLSKEKSGRFLLGVHIADVSHYVRPNSKLDREAQLRCNSTYFPGRCIPMLPPQLSDQLCSLRPNVNRLTVSVMMTLDGAGTLIDYRIERAVIRSQKRFTYGEAKEVIDGKRRSKHAALLHRMVELCGLLKKERARRGSIEFALPEVVINVNRKGRPTGTQLVEYDITHQMIEEFMLKANEVIAKHLSDLGRGVTFRIHEEPDEKALKDFAALASTFGFQLPENPSPFELQTLFDEALRTPYGQHLAVKYIRSMKLAYYSPNNIGHYGLSLEHYCHFTSPIRRYVDLVAHRALWDETLEIKALADVAERCSEQERLSARAENAVILLKKLRLLKSYYDEDPERQYDAVVTDVRNYGLSFDLLGLMCDGFLHVSELDNDYFHYDPRRMHLIGEHYGRHYAIGDTITVMLREVDLIICRCRWFLVPEKPSTQSRPRRKRRRR